MAKMGRPTIDIDWDAFEKLCGIQCTLEEISAWFRCSEDTIERACKKHYGKTFADVFRQKRSFGKVSLRRKMYEQALKGDKVLLIWLSKQYLGMTDKVEQAVMSTDRLSEGFTFLEKPKDKNGSDSI